MDVLHCNILARKLKSFSLGKFKFSLSFQFSMSLINVHTWRPQAPKSLGLTSDVASVCVAPIGKINMAEDSTPVSSGQKRPVDDDMRKLSEDGKVEQKEYLVCFSFFVFLFFCMLRFRP